MTVPLFSDVVVNGERISRELIAAEAQNQAAPKGKPGVAWRKAADALALRALLLQEAHKKNLTPEPQKLGAQKVETIEEALIRQFLEDSVFAEEPSEADVHDEWARDPEKFRSPPMWEASHILFGCKHGDREAEQAALAQAEKAADLLQSHPAKFSSLVEGSDCASGKDGGFLGQLTPAQIAPEFVAALRALTVGSVTKTPVRTKYGYHIIRLDAAIEGSVLPFDAVKSKIKIAMEKAAWALAAAQLVDRLLSAANISGAEIGSKNGRHNQMSEALAK